VVPDGLLGKIPIKIERSHKKMSEKSVKRLNWAQFRFSIIGGLLSRPPKKGELQKDLEDLASRLYLHPTKDQLVKFGVSTIERWYYQAIGADDPIKALSRKIRLDAGKSYAMTDEQLAALKNQYERYPHWSYQLHADNLEALIKQRPELEPNPSYTTVVRRMKEKGWYKKTMPKTPGQKRAAERLEKLEVRSFESEYTHGLWHLDFHECKRKVVDVNGMWHTPKVLCILDDCCRLCCHIQWYLDETAEALFHGLIQAFVKRGLPRSIMSDNGSAMIANETINGLLRLGIEHDKTLAFSPYQNGKQEKFWGQLEGRLMAMLTHVKPLTLHFLNDATQAWAEQEYNRSFHEEINQSPLEKMLAGVDVSRRAPDMESFRLAFTVEEQRTQRQGDGTISIKGVRFEVPSRFRHFSKLWVRYQTWDLSQAYLVDQRTGHQLARIYPQDKAKNSHGQRKALEVLTGIEPDAVNANPDPIPPLLRKLMADYAATGLPPAYIPTMNSPIKENRDDKQ
jgi:putative transposase